MNDSEFPRQRGLIEIVSRRKTVALVTLAVGVVLALAAAIFIRPTYGATAHVLLINDQQGRDPTTVGIDLPSIATSTAVLDVVRKDLKIDLPDEKFRKSIVVRVAPKSSIIGISATDVDPKKAVAITNDVADTFASFYSSVSSSRYRNVINQLRADLLARRQRIISLESRLQMAASQSSYVGSQTSLDATASSQSELVTQRTMAYAQLVSDRAELAASRTQPGQLSKIIRHEMLENDQNYHTLEIAVSHDSANFETHKASYTDLYPGLAGERAKMEAEGGSLRRSAKAAVSGPAAYSPSLGGQIVQQQRAASSVQGDEARVKALDAQIAQNKQQLLDLPASGIGAGSLRALRDAEEAQYQALALRLSNAQANSAEANSLGSLSVIDRAEEAQPSLLGTALILILCLLVAAGLSIAAAYIAESANPRFISPSDIESVYRRPLLGALNAV